MIEYPYSKIMNVVEKNKGEPILVYNNILLYLFFVCAMGSLSPQSLMVYAGCQIFSNVWLLEKTPTTGNMIYFPCIQSRTNASTEYFKCEHWSKLDVNIASLSEKIDIRSRNAAGSNSDTNTIWAAQIQNGLPTVHTTLLRRHPGWFNIATASCVQWVGTS